MHKSQSNVTIAMTEFDNLRELNAYAIDIARDYFAMAANDPRREETAREILRLSRRRSLMERAVSALPTSTQHSVAEEKRKQNRVIMRRQWSATSEVVQFDYERSKAVA